MSYLGNISLLERIRLFFIVNYINLIYHFKRYTMTESINQISEIIDSYLSSSKYQNTSESEKNTIREKLEIEFLDLYHKEVLDHLEPFLYDEFYQLSKDGDGDALESFLSVHLYNYEAVTQSAYLKFVSNLVGSKNSEDVK